MKLLAIWVTDRQVIHTQKSKLKKFVRENVFEFIIKCRSPIVKFVWFLKDVTYDTHSQMLYIILYYIILYYIILYYIILHHKYLKSIQFVVS